MCSRLQSENLNRLSIVRKIAVCLKLRRGGIDVALRIASSYIISTSHVRVEGNREQRIRLITIEENPFLLFGRIQVTVFHRKRDPILSIHTSRRSPLVP